MKLITFAFVLQFLITCCPKTDIKAYFALTVWSRLVALRNIDAINSA